MHSHLIKICSIEISLIYFQVMDSGPGYSSHCNVSIGFSSIIDVMLGFHGRAMQTLLLGSLPAS